MTKHTPTPWEVSRFGTICTIDTDERPGWLIAECLEPYKGTSSPETNKANAKHIVHCVNCHDGLVEALKEAYEFIGSQDKNPIYVDSAVPVIWKIEQELKNAEESL